MRRGIILSALRVPRRGFDLFFSDTGGFVRPLARAHYTLRLLVCRPNGLSGLRIMAGVPPAGGGVRHAKRAEFL